MGVFLQSTEATPCGYLLEWKSQKPPAGHHVHDRHRHGSPVKNRWRFSKFREKYETLTLTLKNLYLARKWVWKAQIVLVWKLALRATHSVLQHFCPDHLLEHSEAMNEPKKTFKWPWNIKVSSSSSEFRSCASLKTCDLQILGNA